MLDAHSTHVERRVVGECDAARAHRDLVEFIPRFTEHDVRIDGGKLRAVEMHRHVCARLVRRIVEELGRRHHGIDDAERAGVNPAAEKERIVLEGQFARTVFVEIPANGGHHRNSNLHVIARAH